MKTLFKFHHGRSLVARLIIYIVLFSSVVTLLTTSLQLYREYQRDLSQVEHVIEHLRLSHIGSLTRSLWALDTEQIQLITEGIARIPDVKRVEVVDENDVTYFAGSVVGDSAKSFSFPLLHQAGERVFTLGQLRVFPNLERIYDRLFDRVWVILLSNGVRTFAVSTFLFLIFQRLVTRHLKQIAGYAQDLSPQTLEQPLNLNRPPRSGPPDEIDQLSSAINTMRENLRKSYRDLSESELRFRDIAECIDAVFWIGSPDWQRVLYVSPAFERVWGRSRDELYRAPLSWLETVHPDDLPGVEKTMTEATSGLSQAASSSDLPDRIQLPPYRIFRPDGAVRWISARGFPVTDENGKLRHIVGIAEDITQLVLNEDALQKAKEEAEVASQAKSKFLAHMSHELRTPLNAILGFSEMLGREMLGPLKPKAYRDYAEDIQRSGRLLLSIIDDILDLSRIEAGKTELSIEMLDAGDLVEEALKTVGKLATTKGLKLDNAVPADLPKIEGDKRAILQVLINTISNAVKFTPKGGEIKLGAQRRRDGGLDLHITDTGCGIAPEDMSEIFTPFSRKNVFMARQEEGTGLGLTICKQLMQIQGFDIAVESKVGQGTDVILEFPAKASQEDADQPPANRQAAF